jgi:glycosyltransferase involved in cell wall biosynthesis
MRPLIHLINEFNEIGGSECRALELARLLIDHADVRLWSTGLPDPRLSGVAPIRHISVARSQFPRKGTFVFVGTYFPVGRWIWLSQPRRRIIVFNTPDVFGFNRLEHATNRTFPRRSPSCEVVYASKMLRTLLGRPGVISHSPINIERFRPTGPMACPLATNSGQRPFRVGRLSRDVPEKFHSDDRALFTSLAGHGVEVRVMGGTCLGLPPSRGVVVTETGTEPSLAFLRNLDCFLYRTDPEWVEPFGRVVHEAMACGLPVVAGRSGGYAEHIVHGTNGFLFDTTEEAFALVLRLRDDPALRARVGVNARRTVERMYSDEWRHGVVDFYTRRDTPPAILNA